MSFFSQAQLKAAAHTLWQAAVASGGVGEVAKSVTDHSVNLPGVEQGLIVAGVAVGGAAASLAKAAVINWMTSHKQSSLTRAADDLAATAKAVAEYQAAHRVPDPAPAPAVPVVVAGPPVTNQPA